MHHCRAHTPPPDSWIVVMIGLLFIEMTVGSNRRTHRRAARRWPPMNASARCLLQAGQLLEQLPPWTLSRHKPLHALAGEDLTRVDVALRIDGDHVKPEKLAAGFAHAAQLADDLAVLAVQEPDVIVREI